MKRNRKTIIAVIACILAVAYLVYLALYIFNLDKSARTKETILQSAKPVKILENWQYIWGDSPVDSSGSYLWLSDSQTNNIWESFEFPGKPLNKNNKRNIWIRTKLPQGDWKHPTLRFRAPQESVEVFLDGDLIYSFGKMDFTNIKTTPGSIWHLVSLPGNFQGKTVYFRLYSPLTNYTGYLIEIEAGEKSDHILNILRENGSSVILGSLFVFTGIFMILILLMGSRDRKALLSLGFSSICIGVWYVAESKVLQLFYDAPVLPIYIANISIFLTPIGFIAFVELVFTKKGSIQSIILQRMWQAFAFLALLTFTLDMAHIASSLQFDVILHIMLAAIMVILVAIIVEAAIKGNKDAWIFSAGLSALCFTGLHDIYTMFYTTSPLVNPARISYWGMLAFILSLVGILGRRLASLFEQLKVNSMENEMNYRLLFENMTDGFTYNKIVLSDNGSPNDCIILETNQAFIDNTGVDKDKIIGEKINDIFPELNNAGFSWDNASGEVAASLEGYHLKDHIKLRDKWYRVSAFSPKNGYLSVIFSDITEMKNAEDTIRHQAYNDSLTGFFNRTYFENVMVRMGRFIKDLTPLSFIAIDIDGLKITNDTFGHKVGDDLIKEVSKIISGAFKSNGIIARVGGDEFVIILTNTDYKTAQEKREMLVHLVEAANNSNPIVPISMSIGIASSNEPAGEDIYNIYKRADDDMYQYKLSQSGSEKSKVIDMLLTALSERDYVSHGHVERLAKMAEFMADVLNLQDIDKRNLILLSKVHDLGKIGVPDEILFKPGKLTVEEYERMKQHVKIGYNIASRSKELVTIATLILHHHEHWNGKGYPEGLKMEEIPLECRILGIIDAYDAMTSVRPYHNGITKAEALLEIGKCAGTQFDPVIAEKFIELAVKFP